MHGYGFSEAGTRILLKFWSVTHGWNERISIYRHSGSKWNVIRVGRSMRVWFICCESVVHMLWEYSTCLDNFVERLNRAVATGSVGPVFTGPLSGPPKILSSQGAS